MKLDWRRLYSPFAIATYGIVGWAVVLFLRYPGKTVLSGVQVPPSIVEMLAAVSRLQNGEMPYVPAAATVVFKLSPGFLGLLQYLPSYAWDAWFALSGAAILFSGAMFLVGARYRDYKDVLLLFLGLLLSWKGVTHALANGQFDLFYLSIILAASALFSQYPRFSGAIVGLLPWLKLSFLFLLFPFILAAARKGQTGEGKPPLPRLKLFFAGFLFSSIFWGVAAPAYFFGPEKALSLATAWIKLVARLPNSVPLVTEQNHSLWARIFELSSAQPLWTAGATALLSGLLIAQLTLRRPQIPSAHDAFTWVTPWLILLQLLNPISWKWGSTYVVGSFFAAARPARQWTFLRPVLWLGLIFLWGIQFHTAFEWHGFTWLTGFWLVLLLLTV